MIFKTEAEKIICIENEKKAGEIDFPETEKGVFDINHTFVDESMQGRGVAAQLVKRAINQINLRGGNIRTSCSYARKYVEKNGLRPVVICHMVTSIDGKVTGDFLFGEKGMQVSEVYYDINRQLKGDAFACGRVTMESSFTNGFSPDLSEFSGADIPFEDYIAKKHDYYAVSFDRCGKVGWTDSRIHDEDVGYDDCHIIEVLTEKAPKEMLAYYKSIGVSYIFAGKEDIDIKLALNKLYKLFGIKKLLLEGGSIINGAFQRAGVVDMLSIVTAPIVGGIDDKPLFAESEMREYQLCSAEVMAHGAVWLRYE
ncbi:MAG: GNAT family N-acetyltransferase [Oscillospiraceae bacterium]|nr:GNAT family N-acetyltransferase [Oscillospiraceae bacterium]